MITQDFIDIFLYIFFKKYQINKTRFYKNMLGLVLNISRYRWVWIWIGLVVLQVQTYLGLVYAKLRHHLSLTCVKPNSLPRMRQIQLSQWGGSIVHYLRVSSSRIFFHRTLGMVGFAAPLNSNIIHESNAINSIYFYIKSQRIYLLTNKFN